MDKALAKRLAIVAFIASELIKSVNGCSEYAKLRRLLNVFPIPEG